jgi:hypothetical protein
MVYITELAHGLEEYVIVATLRYVCLLTIFISRGPIDLEAKFEANLLNTAVFLLGLSQQVSTFAINFQVSPALFILWQLKSTYFAGAALPRGYSGEQCAILGTGWGQRSRLLRGDRFYA